MTKKATHYRFVSKDGKMKSRWRPVPKDGMNSPSKAAKERLGDGYSVQIRYKRT